MRNDWLGVGMGMGIKKISGRTGGTPGLMELQAEWKGRRPCLRLLLWSAFRATIFGAGEGTGMNFVCIFCFLFCFCLRRK